VDDVHLTVGWHEGILVSTREEQVCFDPQGRKKEFDKIFISHSHNDHTAAFTYDAVKYATAETEQIFEVRCGRGVRGFRAVEYDRALKFGSFEVIPRNAGHILGSTQFEMHTPEENIVYTGDINCVDTLTTRAATPIECDTLIIETTYGNPAFAFPKREEVYVEIAEWVVDTATNGRTPVFEVYSVGKAQEIVALINYFTELPVVVSPTISRVNEVHKRFGTELQSVDTDSPEGRDILEEGSCCYIVSAGSQQDLPKNPARATATGWAAKFRLGNYDGVFPLSSHADFSQLVSYIEEAKPSIVYTCYGQDETFSTYITKRTGIRSLPLKNAGTMPLLGSEKEQRGIKSGAEKVLDLMAMPGFVYHEKWIIERMQASGLGAPETKKILDHMRRKGIISYEGDLKGYRLT